MIAGRQTRRQAWWALEVLGTALAGFSVAGSAAIALTAGGWREALVPAGVMVLTATACWALVRTRPLRWSGGCVLMCPRVDPKVRLFGRCIAGLYCLTDALSIVSAVRIDPTDLAMSLLLAVFGCFIILLGVTVASAASDRCF